MEWGGADRGQAGLSPETGPTWSLTHTQGGGSGAGSTGDTGICFFLRVLSRDSRNPSPAPGLGLLSPGEMRGEQTDCALPPNSGSSPQVILPPSLIQQGRPRTQCQKEQNDSSEGSLVGRGPQGSEENRDSGTAHSGLTHATVQHTLTQKPRPIPQVHPSPRSTHPPAASDLKEYSAPNPCSLGHWNLVEGHGSPLA